MISFNEAKDLIENMLKADNFFEIYQIKETDKEYIFNIVSRDGSYPLPGTLPITVNKENGKKGYIVIPSKEGFELLKNAKTIYEK